MRSMRGFLYYKNLLMPLMLQRSALAPQEASHAPHASHALAHAMS